MPSGIGFIRSETSALLSVWFMIKDAIEGETAIKGEYGTRAEYYKSPFFKTSQARTYLPQPNPLDKSKGNIERYKQYVIRAVYYNFCKRTRDGLVGQVFLRPPVVKKPSELNCLDNNADGKGLQLVQVAKRLTQSTLSYGRAGLLTDFPQTSGPLTPQQIADQGIQPTVVPYYPWQITNWATKMRGAQRVLSLVVLQETVVNEVDDFAVAETIQYRALRLDPTTNEYYQEIHIPKANSGVVAKNTQVQYDVTKVYPKDHSGAAIKTIPFTFVGSDANDYEPDQPPMYDLCSLNIAHYRNSADYEESCFMVGQPTPVITGVTKYWVDTVLNGRIDLGSRGSISLPEGADAKLLQAEPNTMPKEAMAQKEEQALALGAKLVQNHKTVRTATEVMVDTTSETSTLHNVANNVSAAMEQALRWACMFIGVTPAETTDPGAADNQPSDTNNVVVYKLNTEYELTRMNANDRLAVIKIWQAGGIAWPEMRSVLKVDGTASMDDDEAYDLVQEEKAAATLTTTPIADPLQAPEPTAPENDPTNNPAPKPAAGPALAPPTPPKKYKAIRASAKKAA